MKDALVLHSCKLLLLAAIIWFMLGAPLLPEEWLDIPNRFRMMAGQFPSRVRHILLLWR